nr:GLPGLI family protein [uncultured Flavobacterium sp.]
MAIKISTIILIPLFCFQLRGQNNGILQYNVVSLDTLMFNKNIKRFQGLSQIDENYLKNNFVSIEFNDSLAKIIKNDKKDDFGLHAFENFYLGSQIEKFYLNYSKIVLSRTEKSKIFENDEFIIVRDFNNLWKLTNESKIIDNRICYKAYIDELKGNLKTTTIAWYDPTISLSYGPKGYGGLPGLIIELTDNFCTLKLSKIIYVDYPIKIQKPEKGKIVTIEEYNKLVSDRIHELKSKIEKN